MLYWRTLKVIAVKLIAVANFMFNLFDLVNSRNGDLKN